MTPNPVPNYTADEADGRAVMTYLEKLVKVAGWQYRGSYGRFCDMGREIWGHSYEGPSGEFVSLDFTQHRADYKTGERKTTILVAGLPRGMNF